MAPRKLQEMTMLVNELTSKVWGAISIEPDDELFANRINNLNTKVREVAAYFPKFKVYNNGTFDADYSAIERKYQRMNSVQRLADIDRAAREVGRLHEQVLTKGDSLEDYVKAIAAYTIRGMVHIYMF